MTTIDNIYVMTPRPPTSPLFPYTTLFRSVHFHWQARRWARLLGHELRPFHRAKSWSAARSEEHTSELQSLRHLVCRLLLEKKKKNTGGGPGSSRSREGGRLSAVIGGGSHI